MHAVLRTHLQGGLGLGDASNPEREHADIAAHDQCIDVVGMAERLLNRKRLAIGLEGILESIRSRVADRK